ncbi:branched-chain amino acid ABC transporter permease [Haloarchaeobius sp. HRN-SO-5]|uniref:branched-chain amino acid ABC transporter permease n=1 Tax=Haloarchaeobius sp. HRN-SO-5 TaxID=3446118 RepID=UPI003EBDFC73
MTPGLVERDGETHVRIMKGLVLSKGRTAALVVGIALLLAVPDVARFSDQVQLGVIQRGLLFGFAAVGLNLLLRHTRLASFGHAAFFGTGAYTAAFLATRYDVSSVVLLLVAGVLGATLMAAVLGALSLRHTGLYFSLLTLAFGQLLYAIVVKQNELLGGTDGLSVRPGESGVPLLGGVAFEPEVYSILMYYLSVVLLLLALALMYRIVQSPFRYALDAVGQQRTRAEFIGLPVQRYIWVAFVISGVYGGIAGALFAVIRQYVSPEGTLYFLTSGDILFMAILGGFRTLVGPLVGGIALVFVQDVGQDFTTYYEALTGVVLLVLVFGFPEGIVGSLRRGGRVREAIDALRRDPGVVGNWAGESRSTLSDAIRRAGTALRILVFGVS